LNDLVAVIIAGGGGTRFWPLSTKEMPKQFLRLFGERTMLQQTFDRLHGLIPAERIIVVTNAQYVPLVWEQLPELPKTNVIGEPVGRDTAAAIGLAAVVCRRLYGDAAMLVLPADHVISPVSEFQRAVRAAAAALSEGSRLYTFGIPPTHPATGYGYLKVGPLVCRTGGVEHYRLEGFKEKPSLEIAHRYVSSGEYFWNSGMFVWSVETLIEEFETHLPDHARNLWPLEKAWGGRAWETRLADAFEGLPKISIDYGIMEKTAHAYMIKAPFAWSDVGGWSALRDFLLRDQAGNAVRGTVKAVDAQDNVIYCDDSNEVIALVGVHDLIVVRAGNRTLITHRDKAEEVKKLTGIL